MRLLRELSRRKLRTALTITGITIGIWALVVFSSMANKINDLVGQGAEFYADRIVVTDGEAFGTSPMRLADVDAIAGLDGVAAAEPRIELRWKSDPEVGFGVQDLVAGTVPVLLPIVSTVLFLVIGSVLMRPRYLLLDAVLVGAVVIACSSNGSAPAASPAAICVAACSHR